MIYNKDAIMEIDEEYILDRSYRKKHIFSSIIVEDNIRKYSWDIIDRNKLKINLKNRNVYIIVEGEEVYIRIIKIPKVDKKSLNGTVKNELNYCLKDTKNVIFTYTILNENDTSQELLVFCVNNEKLGVLENSISPSTNIKAVYLIQFCFLNYFQKVINCDNFIFIFNYNNKLYFIACEDKKMVLNNVYASIDNREWFSGILDRFLDKYYYFEHSKEPEKIYFVNFPLKDLADIEKIKFDCVDLGTIQNEEMFKSITINRGKLHGKL